jgi:hypothetical protein
MKSANYKKRVIAFLDIINFEELLLQKDTENIKKIIDDVWFFTEENTDGTQRNVTQFYNCLVISFDINVESEVFHTLYDFKLLLMQLVQRGVIFCGSVTVGDIFHDENFVYGPGMVNAYLKGSRERISPIYPRIVVDESIIKIGVMNHARHHFPEQEEDALNSILSIDDDGKHYIDYINKADSFDSTKECLAYFSCLKELIEKLSNNEKYKSAVDWLKKKYPKTTFGKYVEKSTESLKKDYERRVVLFLDLLGFKEIIDKRDASDINDALSIVKGIKELDEDQKKYGVKTTRLATHFSDSLVVSFDITDPSQVFYTLHDIQTMLYELAEKNYICRGGVVVGDIYHSEKYVFGPAFFEAHKLESTVAKYPRIIIDKSVFTVAAENHIDIHSSASELEYICDGLVTRDGDGKYYIDYIEKIDEFFIEQDGKLNKKQYLEYAKKLKEMSDDMISKPYTKNKGEWLRAKYEKLIEKINNA